MALLQSIFILLLQFEGISGRRKDFLYKTSGDEVVLPCNSDASGFTCVIVTWLYSRDRSFTKTKVIGGNVVKDSAGADRLSVNTDCSLVINNFTAEDVGLYVCRLGQDVKFDGNVFLSTLTISPSPPDADIKKDGNVTLRCSLLRFPGLGPCNQNSVRWVDEKGTVLLGKGVGYEIRGQTNCASHLTVNHQSGNNRRFTCQFWKEQTVKIDAHYTPVFTGISGRREDFLYKTSGDEVVLPCNSDASGFTCDIVYWLYSRVSESFIKIKVNGGNVVKDSAGADRLSVNTDCSLVINNFTAEDVGVYTCRLGQGDKFDGNVHLSTLTISPSPPDADIKKDGNVTLRCSLLRHSEISPCNQNSLRWVDEKGNELLGKGVGYEFRGQTNCASYLTVNHQSGNNRTFTCQFWKEQTVKIDAHYTPVFPDDSEPGSTDRSFLRYIMLTLRIAALILMIGITVVVIRIRGRKKHLKDTNLHNADDESVNYENVGDRSAAESQL